MKQTTIALIALLSLVLSACSLPGVAAPAEPTATEFVLPTETLAPTATDTPEPTPTQALPTETPTETATAGPPTITPTVTPTATELPIVVGELFGTPDLVDEMNNDGNWASASGGLPNTSNILLAMGSGQLHVTAKQAGFDTWWFTWPQAGDQYIEMDVDTDSCSGKAAYGFILRGPADAANARGYVVQFSCDGEYQLARLDSVSPYTYTILIDWTESPNINAGSEQTNTIGVHLSGDIITLYANNFKIAEFEDDTFSSGRFGLFMNGGPNGNFLWHIERLRWWNLD